MNTSLNNLINDKPSEDAEVEFLVAESDPEQRDLLWNLLDNYFIGVSPQEDYQLRLSSFRWYVILTWKRLNTLDNDKVFDVVSRQIPTAVCQNIDITENLMWYLRLHALTEEKMQSLYVKIKKSFLESQTILGVWKGEEITIAGAVKEFLSIKQRGSDALEMAEFISKLRQAIFPEEVLPYIEVEPDVGLNRILELIEFFEETGQGNIWLVVDSLFSLIDRKPRLETEKVDTKLNLQTSEDAKEAVQTVESFNAQVKKQPTPQEIKSQIESEFKKDSEGNFENIEGVMRKLEEFTEMYDDPKIADMIYFDEEDNRFKWKM
jgi:hypothetical protein